MRIGSSTSGLTLTALSSLTKVTNRIAQITQQLATGLMINRASDNPSGLIAADKISNELAAIEAASRNASYAHEMINVADAGMSQVSSLMLNIKQNVVTASNGMLSDSEKQAIQVEIDSAVQAINMIGQNTTMGGRKLLDGQTVTFSFSPDLSTSISVTMPNISSTSLGGTAGTLDDLTSGGSANVINGDLTKADQIVQQAGIQVAQDRARLGSFDKYTVETSQNILGAMEISLTASLSQIADTDYAQSMSSLIRDEILAKATLQSLVIANRSRSMVMQFFDDTRKS